MPKLVRKAQTNWRALVLDWSLEASESLSLVDWDHISEQWIVPIGVSINLIYWLACAQTSYARRESDSVFEVKRATSDRVSRGKSSQWGQHCIQSLICMFIIASIANTWYCFSRTRDYHLRQDTESPGLTARQETKVQTSPQKEKTHYRYRSKLLRLISKDENHAQGLNDLNNVLTAWNPSMLSLRLFSIFSPLHAFLIFSYAQKITIAMPIALLSLQTLYVVRMYDKHILNKQVIYGQVFDEYDSKFVQPRIGVVKRDVGVGTRPDDNGVYVEVHTPKIGIIDAGRDITGIPRSASRIKMHDWERPVLGLPRDIPMSPNVWAQGTERVPQTARHTVASPIKINGSPAKMFRPAGWASSSSSGSFSQSNPFSSSQEELPKSGGIKRSKTTSSLANRWE